MSQIRKFQRYANEFIYKKYMELPEEEKSLFVSENGTQKWNAFCSLCNKIFKQEDLVEDFYKFICDTYGDITAIDRYYLVNYCIDVGDDEEEEEEEEEESDDEDNDNNEEEKEDEDEIVITNDIKTQQKRKTINNFAIANLGENEFCMLDELYQTICFN